MIINKLNLVFVNIFLLLFISVTTAQTTNNEGTIRYLVAHNWVKKMNALTYLSQQRKDKIAYTNTNDEWKHYKILHFNSKISKYEHSEEKAERDDENTYAWRKSTYFLTRNIAENKLFDVYEQLGKKYIIEDTLTKYNWKILNDIKEVAGHVCMKAYLEDPIRKHKIVAWFAMDMPLPFGPEGYGGLPGMILELDYNDGAMIVKADKITAKKLDAELSIPAKLKGKKVNQTFINEEALKHIKDKTKAEDPWFWGLEY
jgi:GLPGLI family protein